MQELQGIVRRCGQQESQPIAVVHSTHREHLQCMEMLGKLWIVNISLPSPEEERKEEHSVQ